MIPNVIQILAGCLLAVIIALLAKRAGALNASGAVAAAVLGTVIFGLGGLSWSILLLAFFITSSGLSRMFKRRKLGNDEKHAKGSRRDAAQVLANGGLAGVCVLVNLVFPHSILPWLGFAGSLAAANADTWATELGILSKSPPRLITTGKPVDAGTSGGVSLTGTAFSLSGSMLIALLAALPWSHTVSVNRPLDALLVILVVGLAGLSGSLFDSYLGATLQAIYYCPSCKKETEKHPLHICGTATSQVKGLSWMNNDLVNLFCTACGAGAACLLGWLIIA